jgi:hypothetical protein
MLVPGSGALLDHRIGAAVVSVTMVSRLLDASRGLVGEAVRAPCISVNSLMLQTWWQSRIGVLAA